VESCSVALALCCKICTLRRRPCDSINAVYQLHIFARQRAHHLLDQLTSRTYRRSMGLHRGKGRKQHFRFTSDSFQCTEGSLLSTPGRLFDGIVG
jgi:hypothetical protein